MKSNPKLNVLGVCAGNGVCLYPFKNNKNFSVVGNIEPRGVFYDPKQEQWKSNFNKIPQLRELNSVVNDVAVIIGHPDCGDSSILRMSRAKKVGNVKDNVSINLFLEGINLYKPDFWLLENLPGFLNTNSIEVLEKTFPNYRILHWIESVSAWGNSQVSRKRLVIVGISKTLPKKVVKFFKLPKKDSINISNAQKFELSSSDMEDICHVREPLDKTCNLYYKNQRQITYALAEKLWNTEFKGLSKWPVGGKMKNQPGVSRHIEDKPPFTVRKQNRQFGTKGLVLSPREMANIQGVPESFKLVYNPKKSIYWINKARLTVTKTMPFEIAVWFMLRVKKVKKYIEERDR